MDTCKSEHDGQVCGLYGPHRSHLEVIGSNEASAEEGDVRLRDGGPLADLVRETGIHRGTDLGLLLTSIAESLGIPESPDPDLTEDQLAALGAPSQDGHVALSLVDAVSSAGRSTNWLEAAVLAGYVPSFRGLEVAVRGAAILFDREISRDEFDAPLVAADLVYAATAALRDLVTTTEWIVALYENWNAQIMVRANELVPDATPFYGAEDILQSAARAKRATERLQTSSSDNASAQRRQAAVQARAIQNDL